MASIQHLREFIRDRLTAAAEDIFSEFEKTIVQYEEVIDRQQRLLSITWKPETQLHKTGEPQPDAGEELLFPPEPINESEPEHFINPNLISCRCSAMM